MSFPSAVAIDGPCHHNYRAMETQIMPETASSNATNRIESVSSTVAVRVLFFARARDLTGLSDTPLVVPSGSTTDDCLNELVDKFPRLEEIRGCMVLALNEEYTSGSATVKNNDELAIIPPISGG